MTTRFYKPERARLTKSEKEFIENLGLDSKDRPDPELDDPVFNFVPALKTRSVAMNSVHNGQGYQITYNFSRAVRNNNFPMNPIGGGKATKGTYGVSGLSYRMLYEFLCEAFNNGEPFIDTYFERVFMTRSVYGRFLSVLEQVQDQVNDEYFTRSFGLRRRKDGELDRRSAKDFLSFGWLKNIVSSGSESLAKAIRDDIQVCLEAGLIPLKKTSVAEKTRKIRSEFVGLHPNRFFFASGQLIKHLNVYVEIGVGGITA